MEDMVDDRPSLKSLEVARRVPRELEVTTASPISRKGVADLRKLFERRDAVLSEGDLSTRTAKVGTRRRP